MKKFIQKALLTALVVGLALPSIGKDYTNGVERVEAGGWYFEPLAVKANADVTLNLGSGCILGGGWHKTYVTVEEGGRLTLTAQDGARFETYIATVKAGGTYTDTVGRRRSHANRGRDSYHIMVYGTANFPNGFTYIASQWGASCPRIELFPGGVLNLAGEINDNREALSTWLLKGGKLSATDDLSFDVKNLQFQGATTTEVAVAKGKIADLRVAKLDPQAVVVKTGEGLLRLPSDASNVVVQAGAVELWKLNQPVQLMLTGGRVKARKPNRPKFEVTAKPQNGIWTLWSGVIEPGQKGLAIELPNACTRTEAERGECVISLKAVGSLSRWGVSTYSNSCYLADGDARYFVKKNNGKNHSLSGDAGGAIVFTFEVPESAVGRKLTLHLGGLYGSALPLECAIQKGLAQPKFRVYTDKCNRCFHIDAAPMEQFVKKITYTYPDRDEPKGFSTVTTEKLRLRRRYPEGQTEPFEVKAAIETKDYGVVNTSFTVTPVSEAERFKPPAPINEVIVGICAYEQKDLRPELVTNDLCNLYVIYGNWGHGLLKKAFGKEIAEQAEKQGLYTMTIYGGAPRGLVNEIHKDWGDRYLENNIGEYCGYLYQGAREGAHVPKLQSTVDARDHTVNGWIFDRMFRGWCRYGYHHVYSTSGSPLANYELQAGLEVICNELYALGSGNLAYATAEARGAARKWLPEYWAGWNAHEWQVKGIPYLVNQKYDLLYAGYLLQYAMGTSMIVLESGAESTQAWKYTAWDKGQTNAFWRGYDSEPCRRYRQTTKKFWEFVKANPRDVGSPETHIGLVLGNTDGYVGMVSGGFAQWGNHKEAISNKLWRCGAPEYTWQHIQQGFFPCGQAALKPYGNGWLAGSPYGQCDVVCIDDEARYSDVKRYQLLTYVGWNVMTPMAVRTLKRFTKAGGVVLLGTPHCSTRVDRNYSNYTVADLMQPDYAGVEVVGRTTVTGAVELSKDLPESIGKYLKKLPSYPKGFDVAEVKLRRGAKVMATVGGKPLVVRYRLGDGYVWFYTGWEYPGYNPTAGAFYVNLAQALARQVKQRVTITSANDKEDDTIYCTFSVYGKKAYFVNVDCVHPRKVNVHFADGSTRLLEMQPCSLTTLELPKKLQRR